MAMFHWKKFHKSLTAMSNSSVSAVGSLVAAISTADGTEKLRQLNRMFPGDFRTVGDSLVSPRPHRAVVRATTKEADEVVIKLICADSLHEYQRGTLAST